MNPGTRIRAALHANSASAELKGLVRVFASEGHGKAAIYGFFESALLEVRAAHHGEDSSEEESILAVMDLLTGFCDPDLVLLPA